MHGRADAAAGGRRRQPGRLRRRHAERRGLSQARGAGGRRRLCHGTRHRSAVGADAGLLRGRGAGHRADRAAGRPGAGALCDQPRRRGRAELHLLARQLGGADAVPAAGGGDAGAARRLRSHLSLGDHSGDPGAGGAGRARSLPCRAIGARGGRVAFDSNYRPRLWPDLATARREIGAMWARPISPCPRSTTRWRCSARTARRRCWPGSQRPG